MKMTERIKRTLHPDKPMTLISLRLPEHVIEDLKEVAKSLGFGGYQALIRAYISNGLRTTWAEREAQRAKVSTVEEFSQRLMACGVPEKAIQEAAAEMRAQVGYRLNRPPSFGFLLFWESTSPMSKL